MKINKNKGLTLIEIIVVIAIFGMIIAFGSIIDLGSFKRNTFLAEQSVLVSVLQKARSHSMNNIFESAHGVCYVSPNYVIFRGRTTCLPTGVTDETIPANINIASNSGTIFPSEVIFSQLTGKTTAVTIHITDGIKSADITINNEGTIDW